MSRFKSSICVDLLLKKVVNGNIYILLMERKNTGNDDGMFELPGGHLEKNEDIFDAMIREAKEELLIDLKKSDLKIRHLFHHYTGERFNFVFEANGSALNPKIGEIEKCSRLEWFKISELPKNTSSKMKEIIYNIINKKKYDKM